MDRCLTLRFMRRYSGFPSHTYLPACLVGGACDPICRHCFVSVVHVGSYFVNAPNASIKVEPDESGVGVQEDVHVRLSWFLSKQSVVLFIVGAVAYDVISRSGCFAAPALLRFGGDGVIRSVVGVSWSYLDDAAERAASEGLEDFCWTKRWKSFVCFRQWLRRFRGVFFHSASHCFNCDPRIRAPAHDIERYKGFAGGFVLPKAASSSARSLPVTSGWSGHHASSNFEFGSESAISRTALRNRREQDCAFPGVPAKHRWIASVMSQ